MITLNKVLYLGFSLAAASLLYQDPVQAISVGFFPSNPVIAIGEEVKIDLRISDLGVGDAPSLGTFDLEVGFDETILDFKNVVFGNQLDVWGFGSWNDFLVTSPGTVNLYELSLDAAIDLDLLQADSFILASLHFNGLAEGISPLELSSGIWGDSWGEALYPNFNNSFVTVEAAQNNPVEVPLSGSSITTFSLLTLGLSWRSIRRQQKLVKELEGNL